MKAPSHGDTIRIASSPFHLYWYDMVYIHFPDWHQRLSEFSFNFPFQVAGGRGEAQAPGTQERPLGHALRCGVRVGALDHRIRPLPHWTGILTSTII